ncbi:hypothetical protein K7432_013863 [Basidiobolus ranarum]|uniref:Sphingomyelin synthase-like domain-containing protein n=1 Tax=Basidiobolus ranarum TaxID=34480 RepID=A0ABR2VQA1_9FUNG
MLLIQQLSDQRWVASTTKEPLADLGFSTMPSLQHEWIPDVFVVSLATFTLVSLLLSAEAWIDAIVIFRRFCWLTGTLYLLRSVTIIVTTLPCPRGCEPIVSQNFKEFLWNGCLLMFGVQKTCSDNIFSGHTMILVSSMLMWQVYGKNAWLKLYSIIHCLVGIITIVATRMHYTVDIVIAILLTFSVYSMYLSLVSEATRNRLYSLSGLDSLKHLDDSEYQSLLLTDNSINRRLVSLIIWLDGLDLRWNCT